MGEDKPIIGLAGGIGAGKSTVARLLAEAGCMVASSDKVNREALRDAEIRRTLVEWWGEGILDGSGEIDRGAVAKIVFADAGERKRLEGLTHPWIQRRHLEQFAGAGPETRALVIDAPLLFEAGWEGFCEAVIFVDAPRALRLTRLKRERNWTEKDVKEREDSQLVLDEKRSRADHIIWNDGELSDLAEQVRRVLSEILESRKT